GILGHVALGDLGLGAGGAHRLGRGPRLVEALGAVEDHRLGAAPGRAHGDRRAEAGRAARHQDHLAAEVAHAWLSLLPDRRVAVRFAILHASARISAWSKAKSSLLQSSTQSAAAASSPAVTVVLVVRPRNTTAQLCPRGSRLGSE